MAKRKIIIRHPLAPGDEVVTTGLIRDIKQTYGDDVAVDFRGNFPAIYEHNPYLTPLSTKQPKVEQIKLCYRRGITMSKIHKIHFLNYFYTDFNRKSGLNVKCLESKPDIHLTPYEKRTPPISGRYWLVFGGGKSDITNKHWEYRRYQQVVDRLRPYGLRFVQSGATKTGHTHPSMTDVLNIVGWGHIRQLLWQIYHCEGVICPVTCAMHVAAAFDKPCVVVAGGREQPWWEAYVDDFGAFGTNAAPVPVPHRFLHTLGLLDCCASHGCWTRKIIKIDKDTSLCTRPFVEQAGSQIIPECMHMITVDHVVESVMSYYESGVLPPIGAPKTVPEAVRLISP